MKGAGIKDNFLTGFGLGFDLLKNMMRTWGLAISGGRVEGRGGDVFA